MDFVEFCLQRRRVSMNKDEYILMQRKKYRTARVNALTMICLTAVNILTLLTDIGFYFRFPPHSLICCLMWRAWWRVKRCRRFADCYAALHGVLFAVLFSFRKALFRHGRFACAFFGGFCDARACDSNVCRDGRDRRRNFFRYRRRFPLLGFVLSDCRRDRGEKNKRRLLRRVQL